MAKMNGSMVGKGADNLVAEQDGKIVSIDGISIDNMSTEPEKFEKLAEPPNALSVEEEAPSSNKKMTQTASKVTIDPSLQESGPRPTFNVANLVTATPSVIRDNYDGTEISKASLEAILNNLTQTKIAEKNNKTLAKRFFWGLILVALACAALVAGMFVVVETSKESHVKDGTMVDLNEEPVHTQLVSTYVFLADLPGQSMSFLEELDHVTFSIGTTIKKKSISGFTWHNSTSMVLDLSGDVEMVIRDGIAIVTDRKNGGVDLIVSNSVGRRLSEPSPSTDKPAYSWEELVNRYNTENSAPGVEGDWRRLETSVPSGFASATSHAEPQERKKKGPCWVQLEAAKKAQADCADAKEQILLRIAQMQMHHTAMTPAPLAVAQAICIHPVNGMYASWQAKLSEIRNWCKQRCTLRNHNDACFYSNADINGCAGDSQWSDRSPWCRKTGPLGASQCC